MLHYRLLITFLFCIHTCLKQVQGGHRVPVYRGNEPGEGLSPAVILKDSTERYGGAILTAHILNTNLKSRRRRIDWNAAGSTCTR